MRHILHFDCFSGISGDMTLAALLDLGVPEDLVRGAVDSLGLEGQLEVAAIRKGGFAARKINVVAPTTDKHRHLKHIRQIIANGQLSDGARQLALDMFEMLGEAEAASHGIDVEKVHFHEVGAVDSIFDFVGVAVALDYLKPQHITSRPVPTGHGFVDCEHGRLPVPAPAVARLLTGIPLADCTIESELTTPTGAAIVATCVREFLPAPRMTIQKVGIGAGTRDLPGQPNILRVFLGEAATASATQDDSVWQLETNLDDLPGEIVGYCFEELFAAGALDVYVIPIGMKKNRPGNLLAVLCDDESLARVEGVLFRETGTFGVRRSRWVRSKLQRTSVDIETRWGVAQGKVGWNDQARTFAPEYEVCVAIARAQGIPLREVYREMWRKYLSGNE